MKDDVHSFMQIKCVRIQSGLGVVDGVGGFHLEGDGHSSEGLDEDLHTLQRQRKRWRV